MITVAFDGKTKQTSLIDFDQWTEIPQSMKVKDMVAYLALANSGISMATSITTTKKTQRWIRKPFREI